MVERDDSSVRECERDFFSAATTADWKFLMVHIPTLLALRRATLHSESVGHASFAHWAGGDGGASSHSTLFSLTLFHTHATRFQNPHVQMDSAEQTNPHILAMPSPQAAQRPRQRGGGRVGLGIVGEK